MIKHFCDFCGKEMDARDADRLVLAMPRVYTTYYMGVPKGDLHVASGVDTVYYNVCEECICDIYKLSNDYKELKKKIRQEVYEVY